MHETGKIVHETCPLKIRKEFSRYSEFALALILFQEPGQACLNVRVF